MERQPGETRAGDRAWSMGVTEPEGRGKDGARGPEARDPEFEVAVVGLGVLGAFALRALALRGHRVVGFDAEHPPHALGASHGRTRIIRTAYFEHPLYVPLAREAWRGWEALEGERGVRLLEETGALMLGEGRGRVIRGTLDSARTHGLAHEVLKGRALEVRFPAVASRGGGDGGEETVGVFEPRAGILQVEGAIEAALASAVAHGARVTGGTRINPGDLVPAPSDDSVREPSGARGRSASLPRRVVVAPGGWLGPWVAPWLRLEVERQVVFWFRLRGGEGGAGSGLPPVGLHEYAPGAAFYWITEPGLLKAAFHHGGEKVADPGAVERRVRPGEEAALRARLDALFPGVVGEVVRVSVCQYTNTPDEHFLLGPDPMHPERVLLGGGSGHAFKFAPALGERVADWVEGRREARADDPFLPARFHPGGPLGRG